VIGRLVVRLTDPFVAELAGGGRNHRHLRTALLLLVTFVLFWIAFGTAGTTYDRAVTGTGQFVFVALLVVGPMLYVLTRPLPALLFSVVCAFVLAVVLPVLDTAPWPWLVLHGLVIFVLLFAACLQVPVQRAAGAWLAVVALFWFGLPQQQAGGWTIGLFAIALVGVLVGRLFRARRELRAQTRVSESERARRVVLEERARLARDLHDIVAHHMSLVVVQAQTAPYRVPELGEAARAELLSIAGTARSALTETRALLNVLRQPDAAVEHAPQPGLHQLEDLIEATRRAGVELDTRITGDLGRLRESQSLAGFRIVQEALANASRHARAAPVRVEAHGDARGVDLAVVNGTPGHWPLHLPRSVDNRLGWVQVGGPTPADPDGGHGSDGGHGVVGMRERATAAGGRIQMGSTAEGFVVQVFLPGEAQEAAG